MNIRHLNPAILVPLSVILLVLLQGCGGGGSTGTTNGTGGNGGGGGTGGSDIPSAKTQSDVASQLSGYGLGVACYSFSDFGPKLHTSGVAFFDSTLGLWSVVRVGSAAFEEYLYVDQGETMPAGQLKYTTNDATRTQSGPIVVTSGRFSGINGNFNLALQSGGQNGTVSFSLPNGDTADSQFALQPGNAGQTTGKATIAIALANGYTQTETATYNGDGSSGMTAVDSNTISSSLTFTTSGASSGQITGKDPGLPATVSLDPTGTGKVTFADGSTSTITNWQSAASPSRSRLRGASGFLGEGANGSR